MYGNTQNLPLATSLTYLYENFEFFGIKNGHPHRMPERKKVMKKKNDIYKLGCCLFKITEGFFRRSQTR